MMLAIADDKELHFLACDNQKNIERHLKRLHTKAEKPITSGRTAPLDSIEQELQQYFAGELFLFETPTCFSGTSFQKRVWAELLKIPYGQTKSYAEIALSLGKSKAYRAVAQANAANPLAIIVPCHRVIGSDGSLGGYAGGLSKKEWLLDRERA